MYQMHLFPSSNCLDLKKAEEVWKGKGKLARVSMMLLCTSSGSCLSWPLWMELLLVSEKSCPSRPRCLRTNPSLHISTLPSTEEKNRFQHPFKSNVLNASDSQWLLFQNIHLCLRFPGPFIANTYIHLGIKKENNAFTFKYTTPCLSQSQLASSANKYQPPRQQREQ